MSDEEWAFFERFIQAVRAPNGPKAIHGCRVMISLAFDPRSDIFSALVGEQITHLCEG